MKKQLLTVATILLAVSANAQIAFQTPPPPAPFADFEIMSGGDIAYADIDGDNDLDAVLSGSSMTKLYLNDGVGNLTEVVGTPFTGVSGGALHFADVDGDTDQDLLVVGDATGSVASTRLYLNDGSGNFTDNVSVPFLDLFDAYGDAAFADFDGDTDQDIIFVGWDASYQPLTKVYANDGSGTFTEIANPALASIGGDVIVRVADVDGDTDQDIYITGEVNSNVDLANLYTNDGSGVFTLVVGANFTSITSGDAAFADIDGDLDNDLMITGRNPSNQDVTILYQNDGTGSFSVVSNTPFDQINSSALAFEDVDGDNDLDLMHIGFNQISFTRISKLYFNDGSGVFTDSNASISAGNDGNLAFADVDGDSDLDLTVMGFQFNTYNAPPSLYTNDGSGVFSLTGSRFLGAVGVPNSDLFFDVDGDNDEDLIFISSGYSIGENGKVYLNDGSGNYELGSTPFTFLSNGSVSAGDLDGDLDIDVLMTGIDYNNNNEFVTKVYLNDGSGIFTETVTNLIGVLGQSVIVDFDGDLDQDVFLFGIDASSNRIGKIYLNDGSGGFTEVQGNSFLGMSSMQLDVADVDGDGDVDIQTSGYNGSTQSRLYLNDGSANFSLSVFLTGVSDGSSAFEDVDNDGDVDLLLMGKLQSGDPETMLYLNDGLGGFTQTSTSIPGYWRSDVTFIDVDGDLDNDLLVSGANSSSGSDPGTTRFYLNDGLGEFTEVLGHPFPDSRLVVHDVSDVDGDGDLDILFAGGVSNGANETKLYLNLTPQAEVEIETFETCGQLTWRDGVTYNSSNSSATFVVEDAGTNGVDSVYALDLTINEPAVDTDVQEACGSFTWMDGITYNESNNSATFSIADAAPNGCDSIYTLNLTINQPNTGDSVAVACGSFDWYGNNYTTSGTPTHTFTNAAGCDSVVTLDLTVNQPNTGDSVAVACGSFDWYGTNYTASATPIRTFTNVAGCDSVVTLDLTINPLPDATTTLIGATITANNASATSYQWLDCDNDDAEIATETAQGYMPSGNGNYAVEITENGCVDTSDCVAILTVGILDSALEEGLSLYPNPSEGMISWNGITAQTAEVYDNTGRIVLTVTQPNGTIDISELTEGIYILKLFTEEGAYTSRVVKQ